MEKRKTDLPISFKTKDGRDGLLRPLSWDDLESCLKFATGLAQEYASDVYHGTLMARAPTMAEETDWLGRTLTSMRKGDVVSVAAEIGGEFAGNSEVTRSTHPDLVLHGRLGIAVAKGYRGHGIGTAMLRALIDECTAAGLKTIELEALATNEGAILLYERFGFKRVGLIPKKIRRRGVAIDELIMSLEL